MVLGQCIPLQDGETVASIVESVTVFGEAEQLRICEWSHGEIGDLNISSLLCWIPYRLSPSHLISDFHSSSRRSNSFTGLSVSTAINLPFRNFSARSKICFFPSHPPAIPFYRPLPTSSRSTQPPSPRSVLTYVFKLTTLFLSLPTCPNSMQITPSIDSGAIPTASRKGQTEAQVRPRAQRSRARVEEGCGVCGVKALGGSPDEG